jgi:8-oxo-dGTP pyrophosphatase MutT (NUDIX family)
MGRHADQAAGPIQLSLVLGQVPPDPLRTIERTAARALVRAGAELLMVHSKVAGDYKFPGGGVEPGESPADALAREVREECGLFVVRVVGSPEIVVDELRPAQEAGCVLSMRSSYFPCEVDRGRAHPMALEEYEAALGFVPAWVTVAQALEANEGLLARGGAQPWVERETHVLRLLADRWVEADQSP